MAELSWEKLNVGGNSDIKYLKLESGVNTMRLVSLPYAVEIHWEETNDGARKRVVCSGANCPICAAGHAPQKKIQILAIDRKDGEVKILEQGNSVFRQIKGYAMDEDYGPVDKYDIKIRREGSGKETRYTVLASPKKTSLTPEEQDKVDNFKPLSEINKPKTLEELKEMGLAVLSSINDTDDGWGDDGFGDSDFNDNSFNSSPAETVNDSHDEWDDWDNA